MFFRQKTRFYPVLAKSSLFRHRDQEYAITVATIVATIVATFWSTAGLLLVHCRAITGPLPGFVYRPLPGFVSVSRPLPGFVSVSRPLPVPVSRPLPVHSRDTAGTQPGHP